MTTEAETDTETGPEPEPGTATSSEAGSESKTEADQEAVAGAAGAESGSDVDPDDAPADTPVRSAADEAADARPRTSRRLDPDERVALEDQRDFLLQSLRDLEAEHEAGDVDEDDYQALREDYTARAARIIRALEASRVKVAAPRSSPEDQGRSRWRFVAVGAGIAAFAVVAGLLVMLALGRRDPGETATGDIRESTRDQLDQAIGLAAQGQYEAAIAIHDDVLAEQPDNVEAMTYKGWFQFLSGDVSGIVTLTQAARLDPDYPPVHAFLAAGFARIGCPDSAALELDRLDQLDPPDDIAQLVAGLREQLPTIDGSNCPIPTGAG